MNLCPLKQGLPRRTAERGRHGTRAARSPVVHKGPALVGFHVSGNPVAGCAYRQLRTCVVYPRQRPTAPGSQICQEGCESKATLSLPPLAGEADAGSLAEAGTDCTGACVDRVGGGLVGMARPPATWRRRKCSASTLAV